MGNESTPTDLRPTLRFPLLVLGFVSLGLGVLAGLARLGWDAPLPSPSLSALHGPLMVSGFFGTVISLERAVAIARLWAYLGPLCAGLGSLLLIAGAPAGIAAVLMGIASITLLLASVAAYRIQPAFHSVILILGAASWGAGNLFWGIGGSTPDAVIWWMGFLVLTIAGERLELSRFLAPSPTARWLFALITGLFLLGTVVSAFWRHPGWIIVGLSLIGYVIWLLRQDVARRTVRQRELTRFIALCLLSGYGWLAVAGALLLSPQAALGAGPVYDAALHALFVGFVFSMVFGHAPIIFPAVTRLPVPYHAWFYIPLLVLHLSLVIRLGGDLFADAELRQWGGMLNGIALALFVLSTVSAIIRGQLMRLAPTH